MSRRAAVPPQVKERIALSVLAEKWSVAEAARRNKVSQTSVRRWRQQFLESGRAALEPRGGLGSSRVEEALRAELKELKITLAEHAVELRELKKSAGPRRDSSRTLR